ncbi:uncharacterized protein TrAFT101_008324 [Trichoderma asperellum]|uniref:uncharacterized protein n=1 Tax=Trichoderma asperellum TaxID=101201 RepID=UPI003326FEA0|nr:hypothetical protein TrAFT101_008324 [Trichoderma asperellum]
MGGVPSIPTDKTRTVQVIGAGYSRTGTVSMSLALEKLLDGPVLHGGTQLLGREDAYAKLWCDIFANRHNKPILMKLLRQATAGFVAVTDNPAICFVTELAELYPDAKVVLVERDPDRWWSSIMTLTKQGSVNGSWRLFTTLLWPCPTWRWAGVWIRGIQQCDEERLGEPFSRDSLSIYNNWVRKNIASERLLTMELKQGWEPLAKFLGKPVPDEPFPRANDSEAMQQFAQKMIRTAMLVWVGILAGAGTAAWMGFAAWKRW